jgi:hypothetical protein
MSQAVADAVVPVLQAVPGAVAQGVQQAQLACAPCVLRRARFRREHGEQIQFAWEKAREAAENPDGGLDITPFLPPGLRPDPADPIAEGRLPFQHPAVTQIGGTLLCEFDAAAEEARMAAAQSQQPAQAVPPRKPFFIANSSDVGQVLRDSERIIGAPGVPGQ